MNKLLASAIVSAAALVSFGAQAQEVSPFPEKDIPSTASRAEVRAELARAKAAGELKVHEEGYFPHTASTRSRADVVAELRRAQANGEYAALSAEAFDPVAYDALVAKNKEATRLATNPQPAVR
jgi:hypothetical protein